MGMQVGQALRDARLNRGLDLYEAHRVTGIRVEDLRAMEEDRWETIPQDAAEEWLGTYAGFLGLDEKSLLEQYSHPGEREEAPVSRGVIARGSSEPRLHWNRRAVLAVVGVAALVGVIIGLVAIGLGGSGNGSGGQDQVARNNTTSSPSVTTTSSAPVSLELRTKKVVWVCLVDQRGRAVIPGEDLVANQKAGPYDAKGFDVTFGNGSIDMTVNGQPVDVPPLSEPLGFRITPQGATRLSGPDQPSCT